MTVQVLVIGDTQYLADQFYREGVNDCKRGVPYHNNPYRFGCNRYYQWNYGHENESAGDHEGLTL